jgi:hypothetical protein
MKPYQSLLKHPDLLLERLLAVINDKNNIRRDRDYWRNKSKQRDIEVAMLKQQCYRVSLWDKLKYFLTQR